MGDLFSSLSMAARSLEARRFGLDVRAAQDEQRSREEIVSQVDELRGKRRVEIGKDRVAHPFEVGGNRVALDLRLGRAPRPRGRNRRRHLGAVSTVTKQSLMDYLQ